MLPMMSPGGAGGPMGPGGGLMPPAMPSMSPQIDLNAMQGQQLMGGQPLDPAVMAAIMQMLGPNGGMDGTMSGPMGPAGIPPQPAPPGQGAAMTPWQMALMSGGGQGGGGAAGIRGLAPTQGGY